MILKQVIRYPDTNSVEATWVDSEGKQAKCQSYSDVQMGLLAYDLGADASRYSGLIALVNANAAPPASIPPSPIPAISPRQIRQALTRSGLRAEVEAAVASGNQDLKDWYEFATSFERLNSHVIAMGSALGQTDAQIDALWALGATL